MTGQDDIEKLVKTLEERVQSLEEGSCMDAVILPLHGSLPPEMQMSCLDCTICTLFTIVVKAPRRTKALDGWRPDGVPW
ncbi:hypothetical protein NE237_005590 [Protea cynaroides]|uniref:Uncharacterized protein n=1 Tax=Protea cynaroides TaxID=273540 RepID=A0A9Q0GNH6_9MAGN|nr:hypothetical protein NE237_005590 [Protea cynaroides]